MVGSFSDPEGLSISVDLLHVLI